MRKIHYLLLAAVAALASCSQNEITAELPPVAPTPISFAPQMGNSVATRVDVALDNKVSLGVFAFNAGTAYSSIQDMRLRYVTAESGWFLNPKEHYYPADGSAVDFWAYGPKGNTHLSTISCDPVNGPAFTLTLSSTDIGPTAVDIFATEDKATGKLSTATAPIAFTLKHLLAQVKFEAKTKTAQDALDYDIKIYDIAISAMSDGDYAINTWTTPATGKTANDTLVWKPVDLDDTQAVLTATAAPVGELVSLIPGQKTRIIVKARIYKKNQSAMVVEQTVTLLLDNTVGKEFLGPGKSYTYTVTVEPKVGKITFDAPEITDWDPTTGNIEIPQPPVVP